VSQENALVLWLFLPLILYHRKGYLYIGKGLENLHRKSRCCCRKLAICMKKKNHKKWFLHKKEPFFMVLFFKKLLKLTVNQLI
jgi:hypothetical protein